MRAQVSANEKLILATASAVTALGFVVPPLGFGALGWLLLNSSVREGLSAALKSSDVLVTAALAGLGSLLSSYLASVDKRFDKLDAGQNMMGSRLSKLETGLDELLRRGTPGAAGR